VAQNNEARELQQRSSQNTPAPWDGQSRERPRSRESGGRNARDSRDGRDSQSQRDGRESQRERIERYGAASTRSHARNGSEGTAALSSQGEYNESHGGRRHDYDVQSMETDLSSPRAGVARNPIPPPLVTVRSEYPTLSRSRQPQTLTCLITIEVPEGKWSADPADLRTAPPLPPPPMAQEKEVVRAAAKARASDAAAAAVETPAELEEITEDLRTRVENWHGLDFAR
jgi:hypothetical protein